MNKLVIIVIVILFGAILVGAAASSGGHSSGSAQQERGDPKYQFTLTASQVTAVMLESIKITNQNEGSSIYVFYNDLPETFNFVPGDVLSFTVVAKTNYKLNGWVFDDGTFSDANPLSLKPSGTFSMDARMMPNSTS